MPPNNSHIFGGDKVNMSTITTKKKLSTGTWALIAIVIVAVIVVAVLAIIGKISLQFLANGIYGFMVFGTSSWMTGTIVLVLPFLGGVLFTYIIYTYIRGNKTAAVNTGAGMGYNPMPTTPSAVQKDTETVIS